MNETVCAGSGRAGFIGLMLKFYDTWGCRGDRYLSLWVSGSPGTPGGDTPANALQHKLAVSVIHRHISSVPFIRFHCQL